MGQGLSLSSLYVTTDMLQVSSVHEANLWRVAELLHVVDRSAGMHICASRLSVCDVFKHIHYVMASTHDHAHTLIETVNGTLLIGC